MSGVASALADSRRLDALPWDLRTVLTGRCVPAPSISDAATDPRLPVNSP